MQDYYEKSMRALQLAGKGESTQVAYTRAVRQLVDHHGKTPDGDRGGQGTGRMRLIFKDVARLSP